MQEASSVLSTVDWLLLAVLAFSLLLGAWRGFVYEVLSLLAWIASFFVAQWFAPAAAAWLPFTDNEDVRYGAAFVLVFIATLFACGFVAFGFKKLLDAVGLRPVDRTLGALFGLLRGVVILLVASVLFQSAGQGNSAWWQASQGAVVLSALLQQLKPALPEWFATYLNQVT